MVMPNIKPEVKKYDRRSDGTRATVVVDGISKMPEEFARLRARAAALAAEGVSTPPSDVLDDIEVGEVKRFTRILDRTTTSGKFGTISRKYVIKVDRPY